MTRRARTNDRWRALSHVKHAHIPTTVPLTDPALGFPLEVELSYPITVYAGLNGVGKTRLLQQIAGELSDAGRLISVHDLCSWLTTLMGERTDLRNATEEVDELNVDEDTLDAVKAIVGRNYTKVSWYALDFEDSPFQSITGDDTIPFFEVEHDGAAYSMLDMGLGELAAHVLLWTIWYLRSEPNVLMLLDEPDAHFPPRSREPLLDHLANTAVSNTQAFVIATHSREVLQRAINRPVGMGYLARRDGQSSITTDASDVRRIVREVLYPDERVELIAWVEDESAHAFAEALLNRIDPGFAHRWLLYWAKGSGDLKVLQDRLPRPAQSRPPMEFAFFPDGDGGLSKSPADEWPMIALPGSASPDELFQRFAPASAEHLALTFGMSAAMVIALLGEIDGLDAHDWTNDLVAKSGLPRPVALRAIADATLDSGSELVTEFKTRLAESGIRVFAD